MSMTTMPNHAADSTTRWLQIIGACGAVLALAILGASMLLRLTSIFGADGQVISTLPVAIENATRLTHRLAASAVGILALGTVILCFTRRPLPAHITRPIAWMVAVTVILALIGPLTPGYRIEAVTVANVVGGMVLLMAFWWLRESVATHSLAREPIAFLLRATLLVFIAHVATGAAASAYEMHNVRWFAFLHLGTGLLATMFIGASLWDRRNVASLARWIVVIIGFMLAQLGAGLVMMALGARPVWLSFMHGMLSPLLAVALVSLVIRDATAAARQ
jgi:heme A synthase